MREAKTPKVSVILTVFRRTDFLEHAIQCVLSQTYTSWECIISDDANTPAAREVCARFSNDPRIRYRRNETTLGTPLNVAAALHDSCGEYVVIFNDDDLLYPEMLARLIEPLHADSSLVMAFGNHDTIDESGNRLDKCEKDDRTCLVRGIVENAFDFAIRRGVMAVMGCMIRRSAIDSSWFVTEVAGAYDYWLSINLGRIGSFYLIGEMVMAWRQHENSVSSTPSRNNYLAEIYIYNQLFTWNLTKETRAYVKCSLAEVLFFRGLEHLDYGWGNFDARSLFASSLKTCWKLRTCGYWIMSLFPCFIQRAILALWRSPWKSAN